MLYQNGLCNTAYKSWKVNQLANHWLSINYFIPIQQIAKLYESQIRERSPPLPPPPPPFLSSFPPGIWHEFCSAWERIRTGGNDAQQMHTSSGMSKWNIEL